MDVDFANQGNYGMSFFSISWMKIAGKSGQTAGCYFEH